MTQRFVRPRMWMPLALALGGILVLLVAAEWLSFRTSRALQPEVEALVRNAERSTYLVGEVGQSLALLQTNALEALTEPAERAPEAIERSAAIESSLRAHLAELEPLLSPAEREHWERKRPRIDEVAAMFSAALGAVAQGDPTRAEAALDPAPGAMRVVLDDLQESMQQNQRETQVILAETDDLLTRARLLQLAAACLLFAAIVAIAALALRALRRGERELESYTSRVEGANRELEAFAGRVAHDLRGVLAPLSASGKLLELSSDPDVVAQTAARLGRVTRRAEELISGLLAFARSGAGPSSAERAPVDDEVEAVLEELGPLAERVRAELDVELEPGLWVACAPPLLHVVLLNLLSNALKFLEGRGERRVALSARADGGRCELSITDTGPGIPSAALERIFEPFYRAPGAAASGEGLGLATVRRIVEARGGAVRVTSVEGRGSTFRVWLPLCAAAAERREVGAR